MKIVRIIARLNIGGPARNAVLLSCPRPDLIRDKVQGQGQALNKTQGFSTHSNDITLHPNPLPRGEREVCWETVLVCGEVGKGEGNMMYLTRENGIEPVIVPELGRELSFVNDLRAFWKIYKIICREKPDIVHTHTAKAGVLGRLAAALYNLVYCLCKAGCVKCKVVHTFHGHVLHSYFGNVKSFIFIWIEKMLAIFTDRIITVSDALKKELSGIFRIAPEKKFSVVELGFELGGLLGLTERNEVDRVNIGIIGRLVPVKNHKMLLRVAQKIKARFLIIGDGELRQELEDYVKALKIEDVVEFRGWVKNLQKVYEELDILTLTSLNEGTPVSIIEAMAAARPVVATRVGGVSDIVQDGKSGHLIKLGDEEDFAEQLSSLIRDREKRLRFGEHGRRLVKDRFSKDRLIKDMEELYNVLLGKRR